MVRWLKDFPELDASTLQVPPCGTILCKYTISLDVGMTLISRQCPICHRGIVCTDTLTYAWRFWRVISSLLSRDDEHHRQPFAFLLLDIQTSSFCIIISSPFLFPWWHCLSLRCLIFPISTIIDWTICIVSFKYVFATITTCSGIINLEFEQEAFIFIIITTTTQEYSTTAATINQE